MQNTTLSDPNPSPHIPSLDLCRGLAAIGVLFFHMGFLFLGSDDESLKLLPRGYLCVDFFFILSGYVIASSYGWKLSRGLGLSSFVGIRIARLWPLVVLTCLAGFVLNAARSYKHLGTPDIGPETLFNLGLNLAMLPAVTGAIVFPFNPAAWSIFFEMVANVFYAAFYKQLRVVVTLVIMALGVVGLAVAAAINGSLDVGWSTSNLLYALPRVAYSFFLGVIVFRYRTALHVNWPAYGLAILLVVAGLILSVPVDKHSLWNGAYDFFVIVFFFPILLIVAVGTRMPPWANSLALLLGGISYSIYLWQTPMLAAFAAMPQILLGQKIADFVPWAGWVYIPFMFAVSYLTWIYFERPAQRWLRARFSGRAAESKVA